MADGTATDLHIPALTLVAGADGAVLRLPMFVMGTDGGSAVLPSLTIVATGDTINNAGGGVLPALSVSSASDAGSVLGVAATLPALTIVALSGSIASLTLPALTISADGYIGWLASLSKSLPALTISGIITPNNFANGDSLLPRLTLQATGVHSSSGALAATLRSLRLVATGYTGTASSASLTLPALQLASVGYGQYTLSAAGLLPALTLSAEGEVSVVAAYRTWVLNTRKKALTEYDYAFNSYAVFNGQLLSASENGLFLHTTEDDDAGEPIISTVRNGKSDFGTSMDKRSPRVYLGIDCQDNIHVSSITSEGGKRTYLMAGNNMEGIQQRRVKMGRGAKSPYWQYEISNPTGGYFLLEHMQLKPEKSTRRVI